MGQSKAQDLLVETIAVADVFVTDLGKVERVSESCNRFTFCARQEGELLVVAKLIIPNDCLTRMIAARERMLAELDLAGVTRSDEHYFSH